MRPQRIQHRIGNRGRSTNRSGFTHTLGAQGIARTQCFGPIHFQFRNRVRARHGVIEQTARHKLTIRAVHDVFHERLANTLRGTAGQLTFDQQWVDGSSAIVHKDQPFELDPSGLRV